MSPPPSEFRDALVSALTPWKIILTDPQLSSLERHYQAMVEANRLMNLTRITDPVEAAVKHYADSLAVVAWSSLGSGVAEPMSRVESVLDIGTGAGFPALPVAVLRPEWQVTALDGTGKKIEFLRQVAEEIGLDNLRPVHAHSDHWQAGRAFDLVMARAVGPLDEVLHASARFIARSGLIVVHKTASLDPTEQTAGKIAADKLHLELVDVFPYELRIGEQVLRRALFAYRKP